MINRGGLKVFPDEVEDVLRRHPAIRDACVAGVPDRRLGEVPHAWLITDDVVDESALISWCRQELAPYKVPTGFNRVEQFPRSEVGKVQRRVLAAEFVAEQGGAARDTIGGS
jgi:acyl-CoA synthetase (AMP-forming)/AMP-acid ligase II